MAKYTAPQARHKEIVRKTVAGEKGVAIAKDLNLTPQTVSNVVVKHRADVEILSNERDLAMQDLKDMRERAGLQAWNMVQDELDRLENAQKFDRQTIFAVIDKSGTSAEKSSGNINIKEANIVQGIFTSDEFKRAEDQSKRAGISQVKE